MNTVLGNKPELTGDHFVYRMPRWAALALKGVFLLFGIATLWFTPAVQTTTPVLVVAFLYVLSVCFLLAALHPKTGQEQVYFICNNQGMFFPSSQSQVLFSRDGSGTWLFVPWDNIGEIKVDHKVFTGETTVKGVSFSVRASREEEETFFGLMAAMKQNRLGNVDPDGNLVVGYANIFQRPETVVATLKRFGNKT